MQGQRQGRQLGHFPVISDEDVEEEVEEIVGPKPGDTFLKDWRVFADESQDTEVGLAHVHLTVPKKKFEGRDSIVCRVDFELDDGTLSATGVLPARDKPHWFDDGSLAIVGGTGAYREVSGELAVEVTNPKRWSIV